MHAVDTILVAIDFDDTMQAVLDEAVLLAVRFKAEILPVHALEHLGEKESVTQRMSSLIAQFERQDVTVKPPIIMHGRAHSVILSAAASSDVNMIMIGAKPKGLAERLLEGVTANKLMHQAVMPVWVVHPGPAGRVKKILCPIDFSTASEQALKTAIHLARAFSATLQILHIMTDATKDYLGLDQALTTPAEAGTPSGLADQFDTYLKHFDLKDIAFTRTIHQGKVHEQIIQVVDSDNINLVVMGAFGTGSIVDQFMGNNADKMLRAATCSILTVKHQDLFRIMHESGIRSDAADSAKLIEVSVEEIAAYIEKHYQTGKDLLAKGFLEDAIIEFRLCLDQDNLFTQAYEGIAEAYGRLGKHRKAKHYLEMAKDHRRIVWQARVQADIRRQHSLFHHSKKEGPS